MTRVYGLGGFELEEATAVDEHIGVVGLGKVSVGHGDIQFEGNSAHAIR
jgi:hypothetical protein